jgi:hypothetical protein
MSIIYLFLLICLLINQSTECLTFTASSSFSSNNENYNSATTGTAIPSIMLSTSDTITFIYPSEMGYEKDYLHIIFKLINPKSMNSNEIYRIEDAVFDNKTWSIYLIISNSTGGSDLIRLKRRPTDLLHSPPPITDSYPNYYNYEIDSNWSFHLINQFNRAKLLSLDINLTKRRLYLFEFNKQTKKYSIILFRLTMNNNNNKTNRFIYFTFNQMSNQFFKNDGYLFITVARDNLNNVNLDKEEEKADIVLFISNNQTLNICYLANMTCMDYFRQPILNNKNSTSSPISSTQTTTKLMNEEEEDSDYEDESDDEYYNSINANSNNSKSLNNSSFKMTTTLSTTTTTTRVELSEPLYTFGRLMSIKYDQQENALYLNDYGYDCIYKLTFSSKSDQFKLANMETILKTDLIQSMQSPLNPIMSFIHDSHIYWIDYEEGLKTIVYKSSCIRTIYKVKEPVGLKLIYLSLNKKSRESSNSAGDNNNNNNGILNKLIMLKDKYKYKYPPDFNIYNNKNANLDSVDLNSSHKKLLASIDHQNLINKSNILFNNKTINKNYILVILSYLIIKIVC